MSLCERSCGCDEMAAKEAQDRLKGTKKDSGWNSNRWPKRNPHFSQPIICKTTDNPQPIILLDKIPYSGNMNS